MQENRVLHKCSPKEKDPSFGVAAPKRGVLFSAYGPSAICQAHCRYNTRSHLLRQTVQESASPACCSPPSHLVMGGRGRRTSITYLSTKRNRKWRFAPAPQKGELFAKTANIFLRFRILWGIFSRTGGRGYDTGERADLGDGREAAERDGGGACGEKQRAAAPCGGAALPGDGAATGCPGLVGRGVLPCAAAGSRV